MVHWMTLMSQFSGEHFRVSLSKTGAEKNKTHDSSTPWSIFWIFNCICLFLAYDCCAVDINHTHFLIIAVSINLICRYDFDIIYYYSSLFWKRTYFRCGAVLALPPHSSRVSGFTYSGCVCVGLLCCSLFFPTSVSKLIFKLATLNCLLLLISVCVYCVYCAWCVLSHPMKMNWRNFTSFVILRSFETFHYCAFIAFDVSINWTLKPSVFAV